MEIMKFIRKEMLFLNENDVRIESSRQHCLSVIAQLLKLASAHCSYYTLTNAMYVACNNDIVRIHSVRNDIFSKDVFSRILPT